MQCEFLVENMCVTICHTLEWTGNQEQGTHGVNVLTLDNSLSIASKHAWDWAFSLDIE